MIDKFLPSVIFISVFFFSRSSLGSLLLIIVPICRTCLNSITGWLFAFGRLRFASLGSCVLVGSVHPTPETSAHIDPPDRDSHKYPIRYLLALLQTLFSLPSRSQSSNPSKFTDHESMQHREQFRQHSLVLAPSQAE